MSGLPLVIIIKKFFFEDNSANQKLLINIIVSKDYWLMITFKIIGQTIIIFRDVWRHPGQLPADSLGNKCHEDVVSVFFFNFWLSWVFFPSISGCRDCFFLQFLYIAMFLNFTFHFLAISFLDTLYNSTSRFYLADKAVGAKGFKAIWTEIKVIYHRFFMRKMSRICNSSVFRTRPLVKMLHTNLSAKTHLIASPGKRWWFPSKCCNLDFFGG